MTMNIFCVDFSECMESLDNDEIKDYVKKNVQIQDDGFVFIFPRGKKARVKVTTPELLEYIFESFEDKLTYTDKHGKTVKVKLTNESHIKTVKIDCGLEVSECEIREALSVYGDIHNVATSYAGWSDAYDPFKKCRVVEMEIDNFVPASIIIEGKPYNVKYAGQPKPTREEAKDEDSSLKQEAKVGDEKEAEVSDTNKE